MHAETLAWALQAHAPPCVLLTGQLNGLQVLAACVFEVVERQVRVEVAQGRGAQRICVEIRQRARAKRDLRDDRVRLRRALRLALRGGLGLGLRAATR